MTLSRAQRWGISLAGLIGVLVSWEAVVALGWVSPLFTSSPTRIAAAANALVGNQYLAEDLLFTLRGFVLSIALACTAGTAIGVITGASELAYAVFNPWIVGLNSLPKIALMPLVLMWFGMGLPSQVFLGGLMASFPVIVSTQTGVRTIDRALLELAQSYRASRVMVFRSIVLPSVLPYLLGGLRVGVTYAMVGVLIVEFFGSSAGVGYRMVLYSSNFQIDPFFVLLLIVVVWTLGWTALIKQVEDRVGRWRPSLG
jgi:NitT/TauT family transport system permease protein